MEICFTNGLQMKAFTLERHVCKKDIKTAQIIPKSLESNNVDYFFSFRELPTKEKTFKVLSLLQLYQFYEVNDYKISNRPVAHCGGRDCANRFNPKDI